MRHIAACAIAAPLLLAATPALAVRDTPQAELEASYGCAVVGGAATLVALGIGPGTLINVLTGSAAVASTPLLLTVGLGGIAFGSFCLVGMAITPMALHVADRLEEPAAELADATAALLAHAVEQAPSVPARLQSGASHAWELMLEGYTAAQQAVWTNFLIPAERLGTRTTGTVIEGCAAYPSCEWVVRQYRGIAAAAVRLRPASP